MVLLLAASRSITAKTVVVIELFIRHSYTLQNEKKKFFVLITNAQVCVAHAECMALPYQPFFAGWKKKELVPLSSTLSPVQYNDIIEYDKMWFFVHDKKNKKWLWLAVLRRNRQVVAFHIGDRSYIAFKVLYSKVPNEYKKCQSRSNFWEAYDDLPKTLHQKCGKETGETSQVESVNNVIRQRLGRYVRKTCSFSKKTCSFSKKTCSFSKSTVNHIKVTGLFLQEYNLERLSVK